MACLLVPKDAGAAARLYGLAADEGGATAMQWLGEILEMGEGGVRLDAGRSVELYRLALVPSSRPARQGWPGWGVSGDGGGIGAAGGGAARPPRRRAPRRQHPRPARRPRRRRLEFGAALRAGGACYRSARRRRRRREGAARRDSQGGGRGGHWLGGGAADVGFEGHGAGGGPRVARSQVKSDCRGAVAGRSFYILLLYVM